MKLRGNNLVTGRYERIDLRAHEKKVARVLEITVAGLRGLRRIGHGHVVMRADMRQRLVDRSLVERDPETGLYRLTRRGALLLAQSRTMGL